MMILRPDLTYITSFRQPVGTFDPTAAVMATTNAFTMAPMQFQAGAPMAGLGRPPIQFLGPSPVRLMGPRNAVSRFFTRVRAAFKATMANRRGLSGFTPYGPRGWAAGHVVPMMDPRQLMFLQMGFSHLPSQFSAIDSSLLAQRYRGA